MSTKQLLLSITLVFGTTGPAFATLLTGDTKLACETILCFSTGTRPSECTPPIKRYLSIKHKKGEDMLRAKADVLSLCPSSKGPGMPALVNDIANGAGNCDASTLNSRLLVTDESGSTSISNALPAECATYSTNPYVKLNLRYSGEPSTGGLVE